MVQDYVVQRLSISGPQASFGPHAIFICNDVEHNISAAACKPIYSFVANFEIVRSR